MSNNFKSQFQKENDQIMQTILESVFYESFKKDKLIDRSAPGAMKRSSGRFLELNITATCNQKCEYCYLVKNGDKLYPKEIRNPTQILKNTRILLDFLYENDMDPLRVDFFSGEIWGTSFGDRFLELYLEYVKNNKFHPNIVMIPSNCSFVYDEAIRNKIGWFVEEFRKYNIRLCFSGSIDGLPIEIENRPFSNRSLNDKKNIQENYDILFDWFKKYDFAYHPMVAANTIEKWPENYDWWMAMFKKYKLDPSSYIMTLEVRNDEWTDQKITSYLKFLDHLINTDYDIAFRKNKKKFCNTICGCNNEYYRYNPYGLVFEKEDFSCTIKDSLIVRLGDLSIGPCHRTHYPEFIYGKYDVENDKIVGVTANNIALMNRIFMLNTPCYILCDSCPINSMCIKGCMGAQFEANHEPFMPCKSVCELFKARIIFLYVKYKNNFVYQYAKEENAHDDKIMTDFESTVERLKEDSLLWKKWYNVAESIVSKME